MRPEPRPLGRIPLTTFLALGLAGCGSPPAPTPAPARVPAEPAVARVVMQPTPADRLPPALLGTAPAPQGAPVRYFAGDERTVGYLAVPAGDGPFPAVILIHEWNGLVDRVRQVADELAAHGYVVLAADLYRGRTGSSPDENRALVAETQRQPDLVIENLDAAARYLRQREDVTGRIATIGWCFGGGVALSYGIEGDHHEGTAMFYGRLVTDPAVLASIRHPIYGTFAAEDHGIPPEQVANFVEALRQAGIENDVHVYDDVGHGFWLWVDQDPAARSAPALDAWGRLLAYLQRVL